MTEAILLLVIVALVGLVAFTDYYSRKERKSMLNAIIAKNNNELINLELTDKTKINAQHEAPPLPYVDQSELSDEEWEKMEIKPKINPEE